MKKAFTSIAIITVAVYVLTSYYLLFHLTGRGVIAASKDATESYNYWDSINLIPFKTISEYFVTAVAGNIRGHAIRNLIGNLFLMFPLGFYLPFFISKMKKPWLYTAVVATVIIIIETAQLLTMTGKLDIDDFILNIAGALLGFFVFTHTPFKKLFEFRSW